MIDNSKVQLVGRDSQGKQVSVELVGRAKANRLMLARNRPIAISSLQVRGGTIIACSPAVTWGVETSL